MSLTPLPLDHPTWNGSAIYWLHIHIVISEQNLESKHLGLTWINRIVIVHVHTCIESCYSYLGKYTYIDWFRSFGMHLCLTFLIGLMPSKWWWHFFVEFRWESFPKSLGWGGGILICTGMMDPTIAISYNTNCVNLVIFTGFKTSQINRGTPSNTVCFARSRSSRSPISRQLKEKVWLFKSCSVSWQQRAHLAFSVAYTPVSLAMLLYPVHIHLYVQYLLYIFQNSTTVKNLQQDAPILLRRAIYQYIYIYIIHIPTKTAWNHLDQILKNGWTGGLWKLAPLTDLHICRMRRPGPHVITNAATGALLWTKRNHRCSDGQVADSKSSLHERNLLWIEKKWRFLQISESKMVEATHLNVFCLPLPRLILPLLLCATFGGFWSGITCPAFGHQLLVHDK